MTDRVSPGLDGSMSGRVEATVRMKGDRVAFTFGPGDRIINPGPVRTIIDALDAGSGITLVVSRPSTHATLQLKASAATRVTTGAAQRACSARCVAAFADELKGLGYGAGLEQALAALLPTDDLVALRFAPEIVFDQTPGPDAGRVLARA